MVIKKNDRVIYSKINPFHKSFDLCVGKVNLIKNECVFIKDKQQLLIVPFNNIFLKISFWLAIKFTMYQYCDYAYRWLGNFLRKQLIIGAPVDLTLESISNETEFLQDVSNMALKEVEKNKEILRKATEDYNEAMKRYATAHNAYMASWYKTIEQTEKPYIKEMF